MNAEELSMRLSAVRIGDTAAFEEIYTELKTPVYTIIVRMTGNEDIADPLHPHITVLGK